MNQETPFGILKLGTQVNKKTEPVLRALRWCETILSSTLWTPKKSGHEISLCRTINGQTIEIFPLEAANLDLGIQSRFAAVHLPIHLNNSNACVRSIYSRPRPLHIDMVASVMLLLGGSEFIPDQLPRTLHSILTAEQMASLTPVARRQPHAPQPSTSGRDFLPESMITSSFRKNSNRVFRIQFEKRDGTLRNMTARMVLPSDSDKEENAPRPAGAIMPYNPADYNLKTVFDMQKEEYRHVATDRVTKIEIEL
jgi:hypothetical protein